MTGMTGDCEQQQAASKADGARFRAPVCLPGRMRTISDIPQQDVLWKERFHDNGSSV
jgi:hypothetical protein